MKKVKKGLLEKIEVTAKRYASPMGYSKKEPLKEMTMREMQRRVRMRNQQIEEDDVATQIEKKLTPSEQKEHERNMLNYFNNENLTIKFEPILLFDNGIFWAGNVDSQLKFVYMVTPEESTSGVKIERSPDFDPSNEDNQEVEKKIINYYDTFYEYWSKNQLEK